MITPMNENEHDSFRRRLQAMTLEELREAFRNTKRLAKLNKRNGTAYQALRSDLRAIGEEIKGRHDG